MGSNWDDNWDKVFPPKETKSQNELFGIPIVVDPSLPPGKFYLLPWRPEGRCTATEVEARKREHDLCLIKMRYSFEMVMRPLFQGILEDSASIAMFNVRKSACLKIIDVMSLRILKYKLLQAQRAANFIDWLLFS